VLRARGADERRGRADVAAANADFSCASVTELCDAAWVRHSFVLAALAAMLSGGGLLSLTLHPRTATADVPTIDVAAIKPGMKGYGLTVFSGTEPEKFDVEVIDVLHKFRPNQDLILVKTIHPRLEKVKVVAGMSGSPIFLNVGGSAKLAGAYAYGWSFGNEPVAGVTPIASMTAEMGRPLDPMLLPGAGKAPIGPTTSKPAAGKKTGALDADETAKHAFAGDIEGWSLEKHVEQVGARLEGASAALGKAVAVTPTRVATPLAIGGMSERAIREMSPLLAPLGMIPVQAGGAGSTTASKDAPTHYVDGGAIAVQLMRGDSAAQATGTVTHVIGNKLVGFGHPMMEAGASHLPTAIAKILWVLSSDQRSFKIGEPVRPLGTLTQDRESCIVVDENIVAPMVPMHVDLEGDATAPKKSWNFEFVNDKLMTPMWASFAFGDAVATTLNDHRDASWVLSAQIKIKGKGTLSVEDFGVSGQGIPGGAAFFLSRAGTAVGELMNNPWEHVDIERIDAKLSVSWARDTVRLRGAELLESTVDAGGMARVKLILKPYFGAEFTKVVSIKIEPALAGKEIELEVVPAWTIQADAAAPENLDELIHNLSLPTLSPKGYVVQYRHPEIGLAIKGKAASRLPGFAYDALRSSSSTVVPESFAPMARATVDVGAYSEGSTKLRLNVRAPVK
jgi:hypothetical protein